MMDNELRKARNKVTNICIGLVLIGVLLIPVASFISWHILKLVVEHVATILIAVCSLHIITEWFLRSDLIKIFNDRLSVAVTEALPFSFRRIRDSGVVDVYKDLDFNALSDNINETAKAEIIFLTFWIENLSRIRKALIEAINDRNCTVRILIFDPNATPTIAKRASNIGKIGYPEESMINNIKENVEILKSIASEIKVDKKSQFNCRFYDDWVSLALYGFSDNLLVGHYLANKLSTDTHFVKISGSGKPFFRELSEHFDQLWKNSMERAELNILN